ncbi:MAG: tetratricopeptide repeat protein [Planctomycetota bacterium]|jgi:tetratricopeptide (TPR) repeat protein
MTQAAESIGAYHLRTLKGDGAIIAGATLAVGATLLTIAVLHDRTADASFALTFSLGLAGAMAASALAAREFLRRIGRVDENSPAARKPVFAFCMSLVAALLLTGGMARTQIESGFAFQSGRQQLEQGDLQAAVESFDRYIALLPQKPQGYFLRGLAHYRNGDFRAASEDLKLALELQPGNRNSRVLYLGALEQLGSDDEFQRELKAAEAAAPGIGQQISTELQRIAG